MRHAEGRQWNAAPPRWTCINGREVYGQVTLRDLTLTQLAREYQDQDGQA